MRVLFVCLILFFTSTQQSFSYAGRSSWVEPVLSWDKCVLLKYHNAVTPVRLEPVALRSRVKTPNEVALIKNDILMVNSLCQSMLLHAHHLGKHDRQLIEINRNSNIISKMKFHISSPDTCVEEFLRLLWYLQRGYIYGNKPL